MANGPATITNIIPEPNSIARINTKIEIGFSKDIIKQFAQLTVKTANGSEIEGSVIYLGKNFTLAFVLPKGEYLDYDNTYTVTLEGIIVITGAFTVQSGNRSYSWTFSTKSVSESDSDGDGMNDQWELQFGLDPMNPSDADKDPDKDGLTNLDELLKSTDPKDMDSDDDDLTDGEEVNTHNTNPLDDDSDDDGHPDGNEITEGTDPNNDKDYPGKDAEEKESEPFNYMLLVAVLVIIIVVVIIIIFMVLKGKGKGKNKDKDSSPGRRERPTSEKEEIDEFDEEENREDFENIDDK
jgi:hypothetical protein